MQNFEENSKIKNEKPTLLILSTFHILIENCPNIVNEKLEILIKIFLILNTTEFIEIRNSLGICWNSLLKNNKNIIDDIYKHLFVFFIDNFKSENYSLNLCSAEFFTLLLDENENFINNEEIRKLFENKLNEYLIYRFI